MKQSRSKAAQGDGSQAVDTYISQFPDETRGHLEKLRAAVAKSAPGAGERLSYGMPVFTLNGNLVHYAGYAHHVGFYPGTAAVESFERDLSTYQYGKGSIQFPLDRPLPLELIRKIVRFRVAAAKKRAPKRAARKRVGA